MRSNLWRRRGNAQTDRQTDRRNFSFISIDGMGIAWETIGFQPFGTLAHSTHTILQRTTWNQKILKIEPHTRFLDAPYNKSNSFTFHIQYDGQNEANPARHESHRLQVLIQIHGKILQLQALGMILEKILRLQVFVHLNGKVLQLHFLEEIHGKIFRFQGFKEMHGKILHLSSWEILA